jgi:hypothetical protein
MVRRRLGVVSNHEAPMVASPFETRFALLRMRVWRRSKVTDGAFLHILRCIDGSFYIGVTRAELEIRIAQRGNAWRVYLDASVGNARLLAMVRSDYRRDRK